MQRKVNLIFLIVFIAVSAGIAQERTWDPEVMAEREKQVVLDSIPDLSDDQKLVIGEIYQNYAERIKASLDSSAGDREKMRTAFMEARTAKNELLQEILTADQWAVYERITTRGRRRRPPGN